MGADQHVRGFLDQPKLLLDDAAAHCTGKYGHAGHHAHGQACAQHKEDGQSQAAGEPLDGHRKVKVEVHVAFYPPLPSVPRVYSYTPWLNSRIAETSSS